MIDDKTIARTLEDLNNAKHIKGLEMLLSNAAEVIDYLRQQKYINRFDLTLDEAIALMRIDSDTKCENEFGEVICYGDVVRIIDGKWRIKKDND